MESSRRLRPKVAGVRLSHHRTYGPRIRRFVNDASLLIVVNHTDVTSPLQPVYGNGSTKDRALGDTPSAHPCVTPCIGIILIDAQPDQASPSPFRLFPVMPYTIPKTIP